ncbi:MAG: hypothetical protein ACJAYU_003110 [Bradymonadia bacterium]
MCINTAGDRTCGRCPRGYSGNGEDGCADINECDVANGGCDPLTSCSNTAGSRTCSSCPSGYTGTGDSDCVDINECDVANGGCDPLTVCTNTSGARTCGACPSGYTGDGESGCVENLIYGFSEFFTAGSNPTAGQCSAWTGFRAGIPAASFSRVRYSGSQNSVGVVCNDPTRVRQIADGLRAGASFSVTCEGHVWSMCDRYNGEFWIDPPALCSGSNCPNGNLLRPCFSGSFWGAVDGPTCGGAPSQTINLTFD